MDNIAKFLSAESIDRTLPEEFEKEDWKEYFRAKYGEESDRIITEICLTETDKKVKYCR